MQDLLGGMSKAAQYGAMQYKSYIREHPDHSRCDFTQLFADPACLAGLAVDLSHPFRQSNISKVVAIDALGLIFGSLCARELGCGLVLLRKESKSAWDVESVTFEDYSGTRKTLEIAVDALQTSDRVLIVDDWSETGAQLCAAIKLIKRMNAIVIGASMFHIDQKVMDDPALESYRLHSVEPYS